MEKFFPLRSVQLSRTVHRVAVGALFFFQGLCFASWASRIPTIQRNLDLTESQLGVVLFALPIGLMVSLPVSGWLITRIGSRKMVLSALSIYAILLVGLGLSHGMLQLLFALAFFGLAGNMVNISVNTQAISVERLYGRPIMASFHGLWSMAGFTGAAVGSMMMAGGIEPLHHFIIISLLTIVGVTLSSGYLVTGDAGGAAASAFVMPDRSLIHLGVITFCGMMCEGAMFDWSGIYFQKVVQPDKQWLGAGYTSVMLTMATGRFIADWIAHRLGLRQTLQGSGLLIASGLLVVVLFPYLVPAIGGFLLVGFGISSVVPLVYSAAGKSEIMSPGVALAAVSTIGFLGFLIGPPVIGMIAGLFNLRISFSLIAFMGLSVTLLASFIKKPA